ncbi:hypothetical protein LXA43DRAFT_1187130 [Ganoderma leucocontextum]|nr:hypothetical protein LXA43DRAFT_1187130 [Ganoderma leucocontextum]
MLQTISASAKSAAQVDGTLFCPGSWRPSKKRSLHFYFLVHKSSDNIRLHLSPSDNAKMMHLLNFVLAALVVGQVAAAPAGPPSGAPSVLPFPSGHAPSGVHSGFPIPSGAPSGVPPPPSGAPSGFPSGAPPAPSGAPHGVPSNARHQAPSGAPPSGAPSGFPRPSGPPPSGAPSGHPRPSGAPSGVPPLPPPSGVPSGPAPSGPAPSGVPSNARRQAPSGAPPAGAPSGFPRPSGAPSRVPPPPPPSGARSGPAPSGPALSGPAHSSVPSGIPSNARRQAPSGAPPSGAPSGFPKPSGPPPSGAPSGHPKPSGAPSGIPPPPSGAPSGPAPSGPAPSGAPSNARRQAPSGPAPSGAHPSGLPPRPSGAPSGAPHSGVPPFPSGVPPSGAPSGFPRPSGPPPSGAPSGPTPSGPIPTVPKTLASRLSSPQEFYTRLSLSPIPSKEQDLQEFTRRHFKRHGHRPVQDQISCALADSAEDRLHYRLREHAPLVPRRKALPRLIPYTQPLPNEPRVQASTPTLPTAVLPPIPLACRISAAPLPAFIRTNINDNLAIIEPKVHAILKRLQAVFDRKVLLDELPYDHRLAIQRIGDQLEWISDNIGHNGHSWTRSQQQSIDWFFLPIDAFGPEGPHTLPGRERPPETERTPRPTSQHPTRPPSPTPTLEPIQRPANWMFKGVVYDTLEETVRASGAHYEIDNEYIDWILAVMNDMIRQDIIGVYNQLGNKMYEHRNSTATDIHDIQAQQEKFVTHTTFRETTDALETRCYDLEKANDTLKAEMEVLNNNTMMLVNVVKDLRTQVASLTARPTTVHAHAPSTTGSSGGTHRPRIADPPKFKGKTQDLTVEQWFQKLGIWFRYQNITADEDRITTALLFLEGGAQSYMDDYAQKAADNTPLGTWTSFVDRLKSGYRELAPEKSAQQSLEELCAKSHSSIASFAENFRRFAIKSGYSDVELIHRIDAQCKGDLRTTMITHRSMSPFTIPTKWENFLDWVLEIEMNYRGNKYHKAASSSRPTRDPDAMDIDAMRKPEKLSKEQEDWLARKMCFRCGKHPYKSGTKCRNPVYKGYYELPDFKGKGVAPTKIRAVEEEPKTEDQDRMEFIVHALKEFELKSKQENQETAARIVETNEQDFLQRM